MFKLIFIFLSVGCFIFFCCQYQKTQDRLIPVSERIEADQDLGKEVAITHVEKEVAITHVEKEVAHPQFKRVHSFMEDYCFTCHNEKKKKGKLQLVNLEFNSENLLVWQDIVDQLSTGDMPPEDEKAPSSEERQDMVSYLQQEIGKYGVKPNHSVLRRLTKNEYLNTIRDLFDMRTEVFMGASEFPPDERHHNFTNNGESLVTSSYLLDKYLDSANAIVEQILPKEKAKPSPEKWTFKPPFIRHARDYSSWFYGRGKFQDILQNDTSLRDIYLHVKDFEKGVPERGFYKIKLTVEGKNRKKNPSPLGNKEEALSIKLAAGTLKDGAIGRATQSDKFIGEFPLPDDKVHTLELTTWLEKDYTLKITFPQGDDTIKRAARIALKQPRPFYLKDVDPKKYLNPKHFRWMKKALGKVRFPRNPIASAWAVYMEEHSKHFPTLRLYKIEIEGPFYEEWPHSSKTSILGNSRYENCNPQEIITKLATKAFRRPVSSSEIRPILNFVGSTYRQTGSKREALANGISAILCSPQFFYHYEDTKEFDDFALASRLSYFVWSTMPDERLMNLAKAGKLSNKETLMAELERMLKDPKSKQLTFNLADQWLELWKLGSMSPDMEKEKQYYRRHLKEFSKYETTELFDYILKNNKPAMELLTADYTFMNRGLAEFYGVKDFHKYPIHQFIKTPVKDKRRLGILGHMGLMTATANGVDTSPIIRGLWVYETILGKTAPPPPDSVPAIEPDLRNAKTIRDKLVKHREDKECSVCHRKFDHFGFALENFDHLGRWRTNYVENLSRKKKISVPISSYGAMVNGDKFNDVSEMRRLLAKDEKKFSETVASKLLTMAMGRETNAFDRDQIQEILKDAGSKGNGFKDILNAVVTSDLFKSK